MNARAHDVAFADDAQRGQSLAAAPCSAKWEWDAYVSFHNIGQRPATCENRYCGKDATVIVEDHNSYSWCCNECAPLVPNGKTVWPNTEIRHGGPETHD